MNAIALLAEVPMTTTLIAAGMVFLVIFLQLGLWASRYTKVGPSEVLIVSGRKYRLADGRVVGFRLVKGGGTFVFPVVERADVLSLKVCNLTLRFPKVFTKEGAQVRIEGEAQIKIKSDDAALLLAAEHFATSSRQGGRDPSREAMQRTATGLFEKHINGLLSSAAGEEALRNPTGLAGLWQESARDDFERMGLEILSLVVRDIQKN